MSNPEFPSKWLYWQPKKGESYDEMGEFTPEMYEKIMENSKLRQRARLSVLKLTEKDRRLLKEMKIAI